MEIIVLRTINYYERATHQRRLPERERERGGGGGGGGVLFPDLLQRTISVWREQSLVSRHNPSCVIPQTYYSMSVYIIRACLRCKRAEFGSWIYLSLFSIQTGNALFSFSPDWFKTSHSILREPRVKRGPYRCNRCRDWEMQWIELFLSKTFYTKMTQSLRPS